MGSDHEGRVFIPMQNTQPAIVKLETGVPLGVVEPCESEPSTACADVPAVLAVIQAEHSGERKEQLKKLLTYLNLVFQLWSWINSSRLKYLKLRMCLH